MVVLEIMRLSLFVLYVFKGEPIGFGESSDVESEIKREESRTVLRFLA